MCISCSDLKPDNLLITLLPDGVSARVLIWYAAYSSPLTIMHVHPQVSSIFFCPYALCKFSDFGLAREIPDMTIDAEVAAFNLARSVSPIAGDEDRSQSPAAQGSRRSSPPPRAAAVGYSVAIVTPGYRQCSLVSSNFFVCCCVRASVFCKNDFFSVVFFPQL